MEIDRLDIAITATVKEAKSQISQLKSELQDLKSTLSGIKKTDAMSNTSKGASKAVSDIKNQNRRIINDTKKTAKTMSTIRDEMYKKPITMPVNFKDAEKQLASFRKQFRENKDYVMAMQKRGTTNSTAYRNAVENMYNAQRGISSTRSWMNSDQGRDSAKKMVANYTKASKSISTIRDEMTKKPIKVPVSFEEAQKRLAEFQSQFAKAKAYVESARKSGDNMGKVFKNNVESMYNAADGIKAMRSFMRKAQEDNLADLTPEQKAFAERLEKVKAGTWDYAKEAAEEAARAAKDVKVANEGVAKSYDDIATSASKAYSTKYVNPNKDVLAQARNAQKGVEPGLRVTPAQQWQNTVNLMKSTIQNFVPNMKYVGEQMRSSIGTAFDNMKTKAKDFQIAMREKGVASGILSYTQNFVALEKQINKTEKAYVDLRNRMERYTATGGSKGSQTYKQYEYDYNNMKKQLDQMRERRLAMRNDGSAYEINTKNAEANLQSLRNAFARVADVAKRTAKVVGRLVINLSGIKQAAKIVRGGFNSLTSHAKRLWKEFERVGKMAKLMLTRMAIRQVLNNVGEGFQSLALHSQEFNATMSGLINSSKTLGYSISGMVSPLINALAPALMKIIELATRATNALNQLLSLLTGATSWNKAKNFTDSWADSIKGAGSAANKAAKEIKKTVLGFDELNQLQDNKDSGSGGGGGGITDMFETVPIEQRWKDAFDWLKKMWDEANFYDLGKLWGEKLRDALESIPWTQIRQTANKLGKSIASLINGFVEVKRLGYDIGYTLAQGVNTVFEFFNGFVHELHWESIGKFIADTFNGFFESIDWELIKDTVITGLKGFANAINSFVKNFHWDNISDFISNAINTVVSGIYNFFKTVDWVGLARNLGDQLNKTIEKIDWRQLGQTIGKILQSAIDFVKTFLKQLNWNDVKKAIKDLIEGFFSEVKADDLKLIIGGLLVLAVGKAVAYAIPLILAKNLATSILSAVFGVGAGGAAGTGVAAASSAGLTIGGAFLAAIGSVFAGVELIKSSWFDPGKADWFGAEAERLQNLKEAYSGVSGTVEIFKEALGYLWYNITGNQEKLDELRNKTITLRDEFGNATKTVDTYGNTVIEMVNNVNGKMHVYNNWAAQIDAVGEAARIGADKMIDIHVAADGTNSALEDTTTIFPKLGENIYKCADAQDSINLYLREYREQLKEATDKNSHYMGTLDVIRQAQEKNVKIHQEAETEYGKFKTVTGEVGLYIKDTKDAYIKAGDAAKDTTDKVSKYMSTTKDEIKVVSDNTLVLKDNKPAYDKAGDAAKDAGKKVENYVGTTKDSIKLVPENTAKLKDSKTAFDKASESAKDATGKLDGFNTATQDVTKKIPDMTKETQNIKTEMSNLGTQASDTTKEVKNAFSADNWTFSGVAEGLRRTFEDAKAAIKRTWNDIADSLNGSYDIGDSTMRIRLPKVYASGGFPEDGLFMANHNELVGKFSNGKTAVANNKQIVDGIQAGVYNAVMSAMANSNSGASYISNEIVVDGDVIARTITKAQEKQQRRYSPQMA